MRFALPILASVALLGGCAETPSGNTVEANDTVATEIEEVPANEVPTGEGDVAPKEGAVADGWVGKWTGPEGLVLDIAKTAAPGRFDITVTLLDGSEAYSGTADGDVIRFTRDGAPETIRAVTGDETGLKYLAGKQDCLMIKPAEGFCRG